MTPAGTAPNASTARGWPAGRVLRACVLALWTIAGQITSAGAGDPSRPAPAAALQQIAALLEHHEFESAGRAIDEALAIHPSDPSLHNYAGIVAAQRGDAGGAESHFRTAIALAPRSPAAYENLGRLYQEHASAFPDAVDRALGVYERLLAVDPANIEALYQRGFLLALQGSFAESRTLIDRLPQEVRGRPHVQALIAIASAGTGDAAGAAAAVDALSRHPELVVEDVRAVIPAFRHLPAGEVPGQLLELLDRRGLAAPDELHRLGQLHAKAGRFAEARAVFERAAAGGVTVPLLLDLARAAVKLDDHKGALGYLAHARALQPENARVHFLFGMVCVELNLGAEAYESLQKAVQLAPDDPLVNYAMGAVSMTRREPREAVPYLEKYRRLVPDDVRGRFALGAAHFYGHDFEAARPHLAEAARHAETAAGAHYFLARIARQSHDLETARREIDASLRANPRLADAWAELGLLQTRAGDYAEAERSLAQALAIDPENYRATVNLAALFTRTRDPRREAQAARLAELQEKRAVRGQEFLRMIEVVP